MIEILLIVIFSSALLICVFTDLSVLYALVFGCFIFSGYALRKGQPVKILLREMAESIMQIRNILITFILIGMLTGIWRACGTIAFIVYHAAELCSPSAILPLTFILCALLSVLTGTSFGTAATMGVICATMAESMGVPPVLYGGAVLAGSFYGDRCSPMSTSALLVSDLTGSDIYTNIKNMIRSAAAPTVLTCVIYAAAGFLCAGSGAGTDITAIFSESFELSAAALLPAAAVIILSCFRVNVKITMCVSIAAGICVGGFLQHMSPHELLSTLILGFYPDAEELGALMSGGGIVSMLRVAAIVCISASYAGIFAGTGFLDGMKDILSRLSRRTSAFAATLASAVITSMISCNQTLATMLTHQLCTGVEPDSKKLAVYMEDSVVIVAALIPWSIAAAVPLAAAGASAAGVLGAVYLYLQPLWSLFLYRRSGLKDLKGN